MNTHNFTYNLFLEKDYSAMEIVNYLYREIDTPEPKNKALAVIESLEILVKRLRTEIYNVKVEIEKEAGKHWKYLTNQLAAAVTFLEQMINSAVAIYKNEINYQLKKLQQMRQEIAVIGLYLEV